MAKVKTQKSDEIMEMAERVYQRDPTLYKKLIVWVHQSRKARWSDERIFRALRALDTKLAKGETVTDWWPYLNRALEWIRTRDLEKESEGYKHQRPNSIKAILKQLLHD